MTTQATVTPVDEPAEDGALVLVGWPGDQWVYMRDDDLDPACVHRWVVVAGEPTDPEQWDQIVTDRRSGQPLPVVQLRTVDQIAAAVAGSKGKVGHA